MKKLPAGYPALLDDLKQRIRAAQVKAALAVNRDLIALYWQIGKSIAERQRSEGWGKSVVDRLATDLQRAFPGMEGFSPRNIWRMRAFYLTWTSEGLAQPVRESDRKTQPAAGSEGHILPQPVAENPMGAQPRGTALSACSHSVASAWRRPRWDSDSLALAAAMVWASSAIRGRSFPGIATYSSSSPRSV
ncbi:MAG: hypothetical protein DMG07_02720 [Acidobacteria bacterium]|nr:MAG: hypothetical protein DMG07_02720 [Acidobacteriota bacterium]